MLAVSRFNPTPIYCLIVLLGVISTTMIISSYLIINKYLSFFPALALTALFTIGIYSTIAYVVIKKLQQDQGIIRYILDSMKDIVFIKKFDGTFTYCNKALAALYGTQPDIMLGKNDFDFIQDQTLSEQFLLNTQSIMEKMETEEVYESTKDVNTGQIRHFHSIKVPYIDTKNQKKLMVVAKDITDIIVLKQESEKNKMRLEHALDVSEEGLWEWNAKTNQVLHNKAWEKITGISQSENSFNEFEKCILPDDKDRVMKVLQDLVKHNKPYNIKFRIMRPNGEVIWVWDRGKVSEYDAEGNPLWFTGLILNITEQEILQDDESNISYYDQLTGLFNRPYMEDKLKKIIKENQQKNSYCALLSVDLDQFKVFNENYGHRIGDELLKSVAKRLQDCDSEPTIVVRLNSDKFVIMLPLFDKDQARVNHRIQAYSKSVIEKIADDFYLKDHTTETEVECSITASIGGVVFKSGQLATNKLLQMADMALYSTKASGGEAILILDANQKGRIGHLDRIKHLY